MLNEQEPLMVILCQTFHHQIYNIDHHVMHDKYNGLDQANDQHALTIQLACILFIICKYYHYLINTAAYLFLMDTTSDQKSFLQGRKIV